MAEVGVTGVPDDRAGEVRRAYVVRRQDDVSEGELRSYIEALVAPHKYLSGGVKFVDELPKNPTGKLLRRELKKWQ